jgi:hypothetical protein
METRAHINNWKCFYIPPSHYPEYPGPSTEKHTTFTKQGRDIPDSVKGGYKLEFKKITKIFVLYDFLIGQKWTNQNQALKIAKMFAIIHW